MIRGKGHCNTMGTASTMNSLTEALGMSLPGGAAIPAPHKDRAVNAYESGKRIVDMVWEDLKPGDFLARESFDNAAVTLMAMGGSTNALIHLVAMAGNNAWANHRLLTACKALSAAEFAALFDRRKLCCACCCLVQ